MITMNKSFPHLAQDFHLVLTVLSAYADERASPRQNLELENISKTPYLPKKTEAREFCNLNLAVMGVSPTTRYSNLSLSTTLKL